MYTAQLTQSQMDEINVTKMSDHDLLVSMHGALTRALEDIKKLDGKITDFNNSYAKKADVDTEFKDHEMRIRRLEIWGAMAIGALYLIEAYFKYFAK